MTALWVVFDLAAKGVVLAALAAAAVTLARMYLLAILPID